MDDDDNRTIAPDSPPSNPMEPASPVSNETIIPDEGPDARPKAKPKTMEDVPRFPWPCPSNWSVPPPMPLVPPVLYGSGLPFGPAAAQLLPPAATPLVHPAPLLQPAAPPLLPTAAMMPPGPPVAMAPPVLPHGPMDPPLHGAMVQHLLAEAAGAKQSPAAAAAQQAEPPRQQQGMAKQGGRQHNSPTQAKPRAANPSNATATAAVAQAGASQASSTAAAASTGGGNGPSSPSPGTLAATRDTAASTTKATRGPRQTRNPAAAAAGDRAHRHSPTHQNQSIGPHQQSRNLKSLRAKAKAPTSQPHSGTQPSAPTHRRWCRLPSPNLRQGHHSRSIPNLRHPQQTSADTRPAQVVPRPMGFPRTAAQPPATRTKLPTTRTAGQPSPATAKTRPSETRQRRSTHGHAV